MTWRHTDKTPFHDITFGMSQSTWLVGRAWEQCVYLVQWRLPSRCCIYGTPLTYRVCSDQYKCTAFSAILSYCWCVHVYVYFAAWSCNLEKNPPTNKNQQENQPNKKKPKVWYPWNPTVRPLGRLQNFCVDSTNGIYFCVCLILVFLCTANGTFRVRVCLFPCYMHISFKQIQKLQPPRPLRTA